MERMQNIPKELITTTLNLDYKTPISTASNYLKKYPALIINKNKEYFGILDSRTFYRAKHGLKMTGSEKVEKFSVKAPKISNSTSIHELIYYFHKSGVKALPYAAGNKIIGIFERTTLLKVLLSLNILEDIKVNDAMTTPILAIDADANISQAKATMREKKVNRLVVIQNSKFAGLITNYDIVKKYTKGNERLPEFKTEIYTPSNISIRSVMEKNG
jgi:CBS domain-containing protein